MSLILMLVAVAAVGVGCGSDGAATTDRGAAGAPEIIVTTTQLRDFASVLVGPHAVVRSLAKPNADPHDFEPSADDLQAIGDADVVVENGAGLEKWLAPTIRSAHPKGPVVDASVGVALRRDADGHPDPHIWHNPQNAKVMVHNIAEALVHIGGLHEADIRANERAYDAQLDALDSEIKAQIASLSNKKLVTNHDAFGYYVDRYGLELVGEVIPSFDTQAELSARDITALVAKIKASGVKAIFSESSLPPKTAEAIAREAGVKVVAGEDSLFGDSLGPAGSDGDTYLKMERHNTRVIVANLG